MKTTLLRSLLLLAVMTGYSQAALADNAAAQKAIATVLYNLNHFPTDADKAALMAISDDGSVGRGYRALAEAVASISHSAGTRGKVITARILDTSEAPADLKTLAGIVASINHVPSDDAKATLAAMM